MNNTPTQNKYVLIIGCSNPVYFYADMIGCVFPLKYYGKGDGYAIPANEHSTGSLSQKDALPVTLHYADGFAYAVSGREIIKANYALIKSEAIRKCIDVTKKYYCFGAGVGYGVFKNNCKKIEASNNPKLTADGVMELKGTIPTQEENPGHTTHYHMKLKSFDTGKKSDSKIIPEIFIDEPGIEKIFTPPSEENKSINEGAEKKSCIHCNDLPFINCEQCCPPSHAGEKETAQQDPCSECGKTLREQMKSCNIINCYRQYLPKQIVGNGDNQEQSRNIKPKKTASEYLYDYGIDTGRLNDDFNTALFMAMERYAEAFATQSKQPQYNDIQNKVEWKCRVCGGDQCDSDSHK